MPKYIVTDTIPCFVTWRYEIEADSLEEAEEAWREGGAEAIGDPEIGDCLDWAANETTDIALSEHEDAA